MRRMRYSGLVAAALGIAVLAGCQMLPFLGGPSLTVSPATLDFGPGSTGDTFNGTVTIQNTGSAAATVTVSTNQSWLSVGPTSIEVPAGESRTLTVTGTCTPSLEGTSAQGTVTFAYDDTTESVTASIECFAESAVFANPSTVFLAGEEGETPTLAVALVNTTGDAIEFTLSGVPAWLEVEPMAGTVAANDTEILSLSLVASCPIGRSVHGASFDVNADETLQIDAFQVCAEAPEHDYNVDIRFFGDGFDVPTIEDFLDAAVKWETVITDDLEDRTISQKNEGACSSPPFPVEPELTNFTVDDLLIHAGVFTEAPFGIVGSAGPCIARPASSADAHLPAYGTAFFDTEDIARLRTDGRFGSAILHEMGHAIGLGTLWDNAPFDLIEYAPTSADCRVTEPFTTLPGYTGANGVAAYATLTGDTESSVPLEDEHGPGTRCGHWDEDVFGGELMTGFLDQASDPLSRLTGESLLDLGYATDPAGYDPYDLPGCSPDCSDSLATQLVPLDEILLFPRYEVQPDGELTPIRPPGR